MKNSLIFALACALVPLVKGDYCGGSYCSSYCCTDSVGYSYCCDYYDNSLGLGGVIGISLGLTAFVTILIVVCVCLKRRQRFAGRVIDTPRMTGTTVIQAQTTVPYTQFQNPIQVAPPVTHVQSRPPPYSAGPAAPTVQVAY